MEDSIYRFVQQMQSWHGLFFRNEQSMHNSNYQTAWSTLVVRGMQ